MCSCIDEKASLPLDMDCVAADALGLIVRSSNRSSSGKQENRFGVPTGIYNIDYHIRGVYPGEVVVISGAPGVGKSAFALNLAKRAADRGLDTLLVTLELDAAMAFVRICALVDRIELRKIFGGTLSDNDWNSIVNASKKYSESNLHIVDNPRLTLDGLRTASRCLNKSTKGSLIIFDGIDLANDLCEKRIGNVGVKDRIIELKRLAREMQTPVIATVNHGSVYQGNPKNYEEVFKSLPDGIDGIADIVLNINRPLAPIEPEHEVPRGVAEVIVAKSGLCEPAKTRLFFDLECLGVYDLVELDSE